MIKFLGQSGSIARKGGNPIGFLQQLKKAKLAPWGNTQTREFRAFERRQSSNFAQGLLEAGGSLIAARGIMNSEGINGTIGPVKGAEPCSFTASTKVLAKVSKLINGVKKAVTALVTISSLTIGSTVMAFNEQTKHDGAYKVTAVHKHVDSSITTLTLETKDHKLEKIVTTPEHPFYLLKNVNSSSRPIPIGHKDLSSSWVGAGHLLVGDTLKRSSNGVGIVKNVVTVGGSRVMYNLTVETAHTFFVGKNHWLVHNGCRTYGDPNEPFRPSTPEEAAYEQVAFDVYANAGLEGPGEYRATVAYTEVNGKPILVVNGSVSDAAFAKLQKSAESRGLTLIRASGDMHAEDYIIQTYGADAKIIGISNPDGPCGDCRPIVRSNGTTISFPNGPGSFPYRK